MANSAENISELLEIKPDLEPGHLVKYDWPWKGSNGEIDGGLIASEQEIIIVAANYRLGLFGFWFRKGWRGTHVVGNGSWKKEKLKCFELESSKWNVGYLIMHSKRSNFNWYLSTWMENF